VKRGKAESGAINRGQLKRSYLRAYGVMLVRDEVSYLNGECGPSEMCISAAKIGIGQKNMLERKGRAPCKGSGEERAFSEAHRVRDNRGNGARKESEPRNNVNKMGGLGSVAKKAMAGWAKDLWKCRGHFS